MITPKSVEEFFMQNRYQRFSFENQECELVGYDDADYTIKPLDTRLSIRLVSAESFIRYAIFIMPSNYCQITNPCEEIPLPKSTIENPDISPHKIETKKEIDNTDYFEHILETCYNVNVFTNS